MRTGTAHARGSVRVGGRWRDLEIGETRADADELAFAFEGDEIEESRMGGELRNIRRGDGATRRIRDEAERESVESESV